MSTLETVIAETVADWQSKHAVVCKHTQVVDYGKLAELLAPKVREQIAVDIEANAERVEPLGEYDPFGEALEQVLRFLRGRT